MFLSFLCLSSILLLTTQGYPNFRHVIPNGLAVPNPCDVQEVWPGVGHENKAGGGARNLFGLAFKAHGFQWTVDLCNEDSDNDTLTNGQELGDPTCVWTLGDVPTANASSHPGVCDPYDSPQCLSINSFLNNCTSM